jgi:DNA-binding transcriptional regulator YiaG
MANIGQVLKEEIGRLSRRQIRQDTAALKKDSVWLKRTVADMKRRITTLERENRLLKAQVSRQLPAESPGTDNIKKLRVTGPMIQKLRKRLKISQADLGILLGVSGQSVYQWERRDDRLRLRENAKVALYRVRKMGIREIKIELENDKKKAKPATKKKRKVTKTKKATKRAVKKPVKKMAKKIIRKKTAKRKKK